MPTFNNFASNEAEKIVGALEISGGAKADGRDAASKHRVRW